MTINGHISIMVLIMFSGSLGGSCSLSRQGPQDENTAVRYQAEVSGSRQGANMDKPEERNKTNQEKMAKTVKVIKTDEEWKQLLTPAQYHIAREKGTEAPFTGKFWDHFESGHYECIACGSMLFESDTKFNSSCGWPSFFEPGSDTTIQYHRDTSHGMIRTEVTCATCEAHLGHVFKDGPPPTGLRYCINSESLRFIPRTKE